MSLRNTYPKRDGTNGVEQLVYGHTLWTLSDCISDDAWDGTFSSIVCWQHVLMNITIFDICLLQSHMYSALELFLDMQWR